MIFRTATLTDEFDLNTVCRGDGYLFVRDGVGVAGRDALAHVTEHIESSLAFALRQCVGNGDNLFTWCGLAERVEQA